jgi:hypothetical protein
MPQHSRLSPLSASSRDMLRANCSVTVRSRPPAPPGSRLRCGLQTALPSRGSPAQAPACRRTGARGVPVEHVLQMRPMKKGRVLPEHSSATSTTRRGLLEIGERQGLPPGDEAGDVQAPVPRIRSRFVVLRSRWIRDRRGAARARGRDPVPRRAARVRNAVAAAPAARATARSRGRTVLEEVCAVHGRRRTCRRCCGRTSLQDPGSAGVSCASARSQLR